MSHDLLESANVKFHKICENTSKILKISCVRCRVMKFDFFSSSSRNKFSLVLLQITNSIYSP